ncbi:MAG: hypothetical protein IJN63_00915 [Clostridia bacterium]|nr:hypothetical protein [Clostridia bacterium]
MLREDLFERFSEGLSDDVKAALREILFDEPVVDVKNSGKDIVISLSEGPVLERRLILKDSRGLPDEPADVYTFHRGSLSKLGDIYQLAGESEYFDQDETIPIVLYFEKAEFESTVYAVSLDDLYADPLSRLGIFAEAIINKANIDKRYLNERELEQLTLVKDVYCCAGGLSEDFSCNELLKIANDHGCNKISKLLESACLSKDGKERNRILFRLKNELTHPRYEGMLRELTERFESSQLGYESVKGSVICELEMRDKITAQMHELGYSGEFPDFVKLGSIPGIRVPTPQYVICFEKRVAFHVRCRIYGEGSKASLVFYCGTQLLRKNEKIGDIFSCFFTGNGRRYINRINVALPLDDMSCFSNEMLDAIVKIAAKKAELRNLSRSERKLVYGNVNTFGAFLFGLIFGGGLFALLMNLLFLFTAFIVLLFAGNLGEFSVFLSDFPLLGLGAFCWLGFGIPVGIFLAIAAKK